MQIPLLKGEGGAQRRVRGKEMRPKFKLQELSDRARQMRRDHTRAEAAAWELLRDRRTLGLKFRRQVPIDRYIVDFYCPEIRLIVEIDGGVHDLPEQVKWDVERDARLVELGYRILRVPNEDIFDDPEWFPEMIRSLYPSPGAARHPLPSGEGFSSLPHAKG
jgi:very-short-patch-repair endonuclease